jgi:hypothetical protein
MQINKLSWMSRLFPAAVSVFGVAAIVVACGNGDDDDTTPPAGNDAGNGTDSGTTNDSCATPTAGQIPGATCDFSSACSQASGTCSLTQSASCNTASSCLALTTNAGTVDNLRVSALYLAAPKALTTGPVQDGIVNTGLEYNNPSCGQNGDTLFNWLMTVDTAANTLKTGGATIPTDTTGASGFCYRSDTQSGLSLTPVTAPLTKAADGSYSTTTPIPTLNIPFGVAGVAGGAPSIVVLPLHNLQISDMTVSENGNCVGSFKTSNTTIDGPPACTDISGCQRWNTSASLGGYITLAEADNVEVVQLQESLCALLSIYQEGTKDASTGKCTTNATGFVAQGDWCSTTNGPATATCADAYWLSSTFSASAVKINDTCN